MPVSSNPSVKAMPSNPAVPAASSNPAVPAASSNPAVLAMSSNPAIPAASSNPSMTSMPTFSASYSAIPSSLDTLVPEIPRTSKTMKAILVVAVIFGIISLALAVYLYRDKSEALRQNAAKQEAEAAALKHVTTQSIRVEEPVESTIEEKNIVVSLFSNPAGADVFYSDGTFLGKTPIEQKKIKRRAGEETFIVSLEGYEIQRKTLNLANNVQDTTTLEKLPEPVVVKKPSSPGGGSAAQQAPAQDNSLLHYIPD